MADIQLVAAALPLEGVLDGVTNGILRGWACDPSAPSQRLYIEVIQDGQRLAHGHADRFRADLQQAGKGDGHCAFELPLPAATRGELHAYAYREVDAARTALLGSPLRIDATTLEPSSAVPTVADIFPIALDAGAGLCGFVDQLGPTRLRGWGYRLDGGPLTLELIHAGQCVLRLSPDQWRADIAERRQGDGCCGFDVALPEVLCDGQLHQLELRLAESGRRAIDRPLRVRLGTPSGQHAARAPAPLRREGAIEPQLDLSLIVNFYNMRREAERTLTSLSRAYQQVSEPFSYEVLCIDNGSSPPLEADWIAQFGPQFRLIRPEPLHASPCHAINQAALAARGRHIGIMIDGAHVLSPGVFDEARAAWRENAQAVIAVRHWFVGGDQRWLASIGYTREQEDRLFQRIHWPINGYDLFRISAPIGENPEPWFDGLSESNCLLLPTALFDAVGGMDESFAEPGGGFANLDLWRRVADAARGALVALVGEASFHQYHDGTTTNVDDAEKDRRVRAYASAYRQRRGVEFQGVPPGALRFRGNMRSEFASGVRQRPLLPLQLAVTDRIRPAHLPLHFDEGAQAYLQSVYAESQLHGLTLWHGEPVGVAPADLLNLQEIIRQLQPECIVLAGVTAGLRRFLIDTLRGGGWQQTRLLDVGDTAVPAPLPPWPHYQAIAGDPHDGGTLQTVAHALVASENVLVLYAGATASEAQLPQALAGYAALVSYRSYLICLDSLFGQPWLGYARRQSRQVIRDFVAEHRDFVIDHSWNRQLITTSPQGYLRKVGTAATAANYDASLDLLPAQA